MKNEKGFTIVKLITVIAILGVIAILCYPKISSYISNDKTTRYISIAKDAITQVKKELEAENYKQIPNKNEALLVPLTNIEDFDLSTPYGRFNKDRSYVIAINMGTYYQYYFAAIDSASRGIPMVLEQELQDDSLVKGENNLTNVKAIEELQEITISNVVYKVSENTKEDDKNLLLIPINDGVIVSYDFKKEVYSIYSNLIKNLDKDSYTKETNLSSGVLRYNNKILGDTYSKDLNGTFKYTYFVNENIEDEKSYYSSFVVNNKEYVGGIINKDGSFSNEHMVFSGSPTAFLYNEAERIKQDETNSIAWTGMIMYPNNSNYSIESCGVIILKSKQNVEDFNIDTPNVQVAKTVNGCDNAGVFQIRKNNPKSGETWYGKSFVTYFDLQNKRHTVYSDNIVKLDV